MATWAGILLLSSILDLHQFLFFCGYHGIDILDALVGHLLDLIERILKIVFGDLGSLFLFLELIIGIAADVSDSDLGFFTHLLDDLGQFFSAFLCDNGNDETNILAVIAGIDAEVRGQNRLFDQFDC